MGKPEVSVIIPTYNRPRRLAQCLAGFCAVRGEDFEVIVVDDGSPKPAAAVTRAFADRLDITCLCQENTGPAGARNAGARAARAPILAFTDDDCLPEPDWLHGMAEAVRKDPYALVGGRTRNLLKENICSATSQDLVGFLYEYAARHSAGLRFFASNNLACSAHCHAAVGGFDESFPLAAGEDRDYSLRWMAADWPMVYVPDAVMGHAHQLDFRRFLRQHFNYGRGARHIRVRIAARKADKIHFEGMRFYVRMAAYPFREKRPRPFLRMILLGLSQVALVAGFIAEGRRRRS